LRTCLAADRNVRAPARSFGGLFENQGVITTPAQNAFQHLAVRFASTWLTSDVSVTASVPSYVVMYLVMNFEHFERGYLLPMGCKDLIDVINLQDKDDIIHLLAKPQTQILKIWSGALNLVPPVKGELVISERVSVEQLAELLGQKPFKIIADAMQLGIFATVKQSLPFGTIQRIARNYGYIAKRVT